MACAKWRRQQYFRYYAPLHSKGSNRNAEWLYTRGRTRGRRALPRRGHRGWSGKLGRFPIARSSLYFSSGYYWGWANTDRRLPHEPLLFFFWGKCTLQGYVRTGCCAPKTGPWQRHRTLSCRFLIWKCPQALRNVAQVCPFSSKCPRSRWGSFAWFPATDRPQWGEKRGQVRCICWKRQFLLHLMKAVNHSSEEDAIVLSKENVFEIQPSRRLHWSQWPKSPLCTLTYMMTSKIERFFGWWR